MTSSRTRRTLASGEFSRRTGLSIKALRLYDLGGLLVPAEVDQATGYRRYDGSQVERARRISLLRQLDMPLAAIAEVLAGPDDQAADQLDRWWAGQEAGQRERRASYEYLRAHLLRRAAPWPPHPVEVTRVPATKLASIRREVDQAGLVAAIVEGEQEIRAFLAVAGATTTGESWVVYHGVVSPDNEGAIEIALPFTGAVEPAGRIAIRVEPAHSLAACTITRRECSYPLIMLAYEDVRAAVDARGLVPSGPPREVYLADAACADADTDEPFAQVGRPVGGAS